MRTPINRLIFTPTEQHTEMAIGIQRELAADLHCFQGNAEPLKKEMSMMVAGVGFEPTTFRL